MTAKVQRGNLQSSVQCAASLNTSLAKMSSYLYLIYHVNLHVHVMCSGTLCVAKLSVSSTC